MLTRVFAAVLLGSAWMASAQEVVYPVPPHQAHRPVSAGRADRSPRPLPRRKTEDHPQAAGNRRKQTRRRHAGRRRVRRQATCRRLHAADGDQHHARHQPCALSQTVTDRSDQGFRPHFQVGSVNFFLIANPEFPAPSDMKWFIDAIKRESGQVQLRLRRQRQPASPLHGSC